MVHIIKWGASFGWSCDPNSAWGSKETITIRKTRLTLWIKSYQKSLQWLLHCQQIRLHHFSSRLRSILQHPRLHYFQFLPILSEEIFEKWINRIQTKITKLFSLKIKRWNEERINELLFLMTHFTWVIIHGSSIWVISRWWMALFSWRT